MRREVRKGGREEGRKERKTSDTPKHRMRSRRSFVPIRHSCSPTRLSPREDLPNLSRVGDDLFPNGVEGDIVRRGPSDLDGGGGRVEEILCETKDGRSTRQFHSREGGVVEFGFETH